MCFIAHNALGHHGRFGRIFSACKTRIIVVVKYSLLAPRLAIDDGMKWFHDEMGVDRYSWNCIFLWG
jgi:hypothetical protein